MKTNIKIRNILFFLLIQCLAWTAYAQDAAIKEAETAVYQRRLWKSNRVI